MYVRKDDGDLNVDMYATDDGDTTTDEKLAVSTVALATEYVWALCYQCTGANTGKMLFYENGTLKGELDCVTAPTSEMALFFNCTQGAANTARIVTIDYLGFASER